MRFFLSMVMVVGMALPGAAFAQAEKHGDKERQDDVRRHRALATVHEAAAKCIESGKTIKDCHEQLRKDCKGVGIGKYCGMKHGH
jgi:hypothetical protein